MWNLKVKKEQQLRPYRDAIARMVAEKIIALQHRIVHLLQRWDRQLSITQKKALLLIFCMVSSTYCSYLFFHALSGKANMAISFRHVPPVTKPPPSRKKRIAIKDH
jgi:uncharacterized membrane protein